MKKKSILTISGLAVLTVTSAFIELGKSAITMPLQAARDWLAPTPVPTLGSEVRVVVPDDFPALKEVFVTRAISGTHIELRAFKPRNEQ